MAAQRGGRERVKAKVKSSSAKRPPAARARAAKKGAGLRKRQTEKRGSAPRTRAVKKAAAPRRAPAQPAAKPAVKLAVKTAVKAVPAKGSPARILKADGKTVLRHAAPPAPPPLPPTMKGGRRSGKNKAAREAAAKAREAFLHSVIPTRIERLEILRQLYDKRREAPQKKEGAERPNEEEESEGEFVVSDEIVSSDSSEPT